MKKEKIKILAVETSCDETAAAVITAAATKLRMNHESTNEQPIILSNIVSSQVDLHAKTGGVVPEVASRAHIESIMPVVEEALEESVVSGQWSVEKTTIHKPQTTNDLLSQITHVAVTSGPGLIGSLLVGFNAAKTIAYAKNLPFFPINHIEGHIYSAFAEPPTKLRTKRTYELTNKSNSTIQQFNN